MPVEAHCGTLTAYEDRAAAQGRQIVIHYAVVPAISAGPQPDPIVFFAGGPGQSAIKLSGAAYHVLRQVRRDREIVLIDIRGTGKSRSLNCGQPDKTAIPAAYYRAVTSDVPVLLRGSANKNAGCGPRFYSPL